MTIDLPWPPKALHPNARPHWSAKAKAAKKARSDARVLTIMAMGRDHRLYDGQTRLPLALTFNPPDKRRRDLDGMLAACKSQLDGVADALMANDNLFDLKLTVGEPVKNGRVVVVV